MSTEAYLYGKIPTKAAQLRPAVMLCAHAAAAYKYVKRDTSV